ncbi:cupin domain-containing protein [Nitriliruptoraceae bacterium ZYF776]|nr:cupin domain-containing protein [Profundirhabdus halotolerans]
MSLDPQTITGEEVDADLLELYRGLDAVDLQPLWTITAQLLTPTPRPKAMPWLWAATTMRPLAERAIELVPVERGGERRVLAMANPGLGGRPYAAGTLWGALQCLGPRETAPAHRHSPGAIRFVLEGEGVWTTVDGDACDMAPGDLVLTPGNTWHDHTNGGDGHMFWFDGLDLPMVESLDAVFFESYPDDQQQTGAAHDRSLAAHGAAGPRHVVGTVDGALDPTPSPLLRYPWSDTAPELERLAAASDDAVVTLEYVNPYTGASVLPTMSCAVSRITPGRVDRPVRRTGNAVHVVLHGHGTSVIDGQRFRWGPGDVFVVPSWAAVEHAADEPADVFVCADTPVLRALGIHREQHLDTPQTVTGEFRPR